MVVILMAQWVIKHGSATGGLIVDALERGGRSCARDMSLSYSSSGRLGSGNAWSESEDRESVDQSASGYQEQYQYDQEECQTGRETTMLPWPDILRWLQRSWQ